MADVKANFEGDIRRFALPTPATLADLRSTVSTLYSLDDFIIKYKDGEGDLVTIGSDADLAESLAAVPSTVLRLNVFRPPADCDMDPPTPDQAMDGLSGLFEAALSPRSTGFAWPRPPGTADEGEPWPSRRHRPGHGRGHGHGRGRGFGRAYGAHRARRHGHWAAHGPFMPHLGVHRGRFSVHRGGSRIHRGGLGARRGAHCEMRGGRSPGRAGFRPSGFQLAVARLHAALDRVNPDVVAALRALLRDLTARTTVPALLAAMPAALAGVRAFLDAGTVVDGEPGPSAAAALDEAEAAVRAAFAPHCGAARADAAAAFARRALADPSVVALLRQVAGAREWGARRHDDSESAARGRFDVHRGVGCDGCGMGPIVGVRHRCTSRPDYDLCDACVAGGTAHLDGREFRAIRFPWEADGAGSRVPRPTLALGARGPQVAMLQKTLTDLGFMSADMYRARVGLYGPHTAAAVNRFREAYGLGRQAQYGLYDDVVAASMQSLLESNVPPSAAAGPAGGAAGGTMAMVAGDSPAAA